MFARVLNRFNGNIFYEKMSSQQTKIALRINDDNINHHLWNNRGVW